MHKKLYISAGIIIVLAIVIGLLLSSKIGDETPETTSNQNYVGNSVEECSRIQVMCVEGFERFDDENGCGCREVNNGVVGEIKEIVEKRNEITQEPTKVKVAEKSDEIILTPASTECVVPFRGPSCSKMSLEECELNSDCKLNKYRTSCRALNAQTSVMLYEGEMKTYTNELGNNVAYDPIVVSLKDDYFNDAEGEYLACLVDGEIVGYASLIQIYWIKLNVKSIAEAESAIQILEAEQSVDFAMFDVEVGP